MPTFRVWDSADGSDLAEIEATEIEADDVQAAAVAYAEDDSDGQADSIYFGGHDLLVLDADGCTRCVRITAEATVTYSAQEIQG